MSSPAVIVGSGESGLETFVVVEVLVEDETAYELSTCGLAGGSSSSA